MKTGILSVIFIFISISTPSLAVDNDALNHIDYSQLKYKQLKLKKNNRIKFEENSPQLSFISQPRYYKAFKLPDNIYYTLELNINIDGYFSKTRSLFPKMIVLDESFNVVHNNIDEGFNLYFKSSTFGRGSLETKQRMPFKARYLIIFSDNNEESKFHLTYETGPQVMMMGNTPVLLHNHETKTDTINIVETGKFKLKLDPMF